MSDDDDLACLAATMVAVSVVRRRRRRRRKSCLLCSWISRRPTQHYLGTSTATAWRRNCRICPDHYDELLHLPPTMIKTVERQCHLTRKYSWTVMNVRLIAERRE